MKPNASSPLSITGTCTRMPEAPVTTLIPVRTSDIGSVNSRVGVPASSASTIRPQSISGLLTSYQRPLMRTWVSRLVVE